jgi:hypothetical protein
MIRLTRSLTPLSLTAVSLIALTACATTGQAATSTVLQPRRWRPRTVPRGVRNW